eukprot:TRINITY_DN14760_c0_g1::TRINITY_DN14760_c0_g1_i1::g.30224::m.30224 TRINITY_DN14760_c0_g1::TRINITY_DN14760_c0_g1_i1::g.30224  ORF type:complete len:153 (-),score=1.87,sp/Q55EY8/UBE2W_DICDI/49.33/6e-53,UQ_con/PF00179.21/7.3e-31,Prok-E2_B/PF14461.1/0.013 TRINITY_DN14760_c0_g1_i1:539-997(-)
MGLTETAKRRLMREYKNLSEKPIPGIQVQLEGDALDRWIVTITGAEGTLYANEQYRLLFEFDAQYPIHAPVVIFMGEPPIHEHVYGNGHICLDVLYSGWTPVLTVESVCLSIVSMLSSATIKKRPPDNDSYVAKARNRNPKSTTWFFHDDKV